MTRRVLLLVTGKCEQLGLPASLSRVFADADVSFEANEWLIDSFTSARLAGDAPEEGIPRTVDKFAQELVAAVEADCPDLVVAIDDLELANLDQPESVVALFRSAVVRHLENHEFPSGRALARAKERLRARCSFHLFAPMIEAYFFAEAKALVRAGAVQASKVDSAGIDLEKFVTTDARYLSVPDTDDRQGWARPDRATHPKRYLKFLCDPGNPSSRKYREGRGGMAALSSLAWDDVFAPPEGVALARSLFADLAEGLGVGTRFTGACHVATYDRLHASVLRNV